MMPHHAHNADVAMAQHDQGQHERENNHDDCVAFLVYLVGRGRPELSAVVVSSGGGQ